MNLKTTVPLAVAVVLGLVAAIVASQLVKQRPVAVAGPGQTAVLNLTDVVVAARDITPGGTLGTEDLKVLRIESATAPVNVAANPAAILGRVAKVQVPAGQMVHMSMLAEKGVEGGLPGVIAPGHRAMTIEINEFSGVAGLLEPGNRIDIIARIAEAQGGTQTSRTIVQNVPIIAVGAQLTAKNQTGEVAPVPVPTDAPPQAKVMPRSVTVLVTPEDAEKIDLATSTNSARLVLRASTDTETAQVSGATLASLRGNPSRAAREPIVETASAEKSDADSVFGPSDAKAAAAKPTPTVRTITVIRAGVPTQMDVDEPAAAPPTPATDGQSASVAE